MYKTLIVYLLMSNPPIKKVRARTIYHNRWLALEQHDVEVRASGHRFSYSFLAMAPSVMVVAVTRERKVVLVRQYRYPSVEYSFELPGGGSRGLELPDAARQELREEPVTRPRGCGSWGISSSIPACRTKSVTSSSPAAGEPEPETTEHLSVQEVSYRRLRAMIRRGEFRDGMGLAALHLAAPSLENKLAAALRVASVE